MRLFSFVADILDFNFLIDFVRFHCPLDSSLILYFTFSIVQVNHLHNYCHLQNYNSVNLLIAYYFADDFENINNLHYFDKNLFHTFTREAQILIFILIINLDLPNNSNDSILKALGNQDYLLHCSSF